MRAYRDPSWVTLARVTLRDPLASSLVQRDEAARVLAKAALAVASGNVRDRELAEVVASHLGLNLNGGEDLFRLASRFGDKAEGSNGAHGRIGTGKASHCYVYPGVAAVGGAQ